MFRLLLCFIIVICSTATGFAMSQKLYRRKSILNDFSSLLSNAATKIRYTSSPLCDIFADNFAGFEFSGDKPFCDQWQDMLSRFCDVLCDDDIKLLKDFASQLGKTDTDGQLSNIEMYTQLLSKNISSADDSIIKKSKLYRVLGFSLGLAVSILVI